MHIIQNNTIKGMWHTLPQNPVDLIGSQPLESIINLDVYSTMLSNKVIKHVTDICESTLLNVYRPFQIDFVCI